MPRLFDWEQLQEDVRVVLESVDSRAKVTKGSGAVKGNGDVISDNYMAECKYRSTVAFSINPSVVHKVQEEARLLGKIPIIATRNKAKETLVTMTLKDFAKIAGLPKDNNGRDNTSSSELLH